MTAPSRRQVLAGAGATVAAVAVPTGLEASPFRPVPGGVYRIIGLQKAMRDLSLYEETKLIRKSVAARRLLLVKE